MNNCPFLDFVIAKNINISDDFLNYIKDYRNIPGFIELKDFDSKKEYLFSIKDGISLIINKNINSECYRIPISDTNIKDIIEGSNIMDKLLDISKQLVEGLVIHDWSIEAVKDVLQDLNIMYRIFVIDSSLQIIKRYLDKYSKDMNSNQIYLNLKNLHAIELLIELYKEYKNEFES